MDSKSDSMSMIRLTSSNYSRWKSRMTDLLYCKDLFEPIEGEEGRPEGKSDAKWKMMNRKASALIRSWVDESIYHHVEEETDACKLWKKLELLYERKTAQNKATLIRKLVNLKYRDGQSVSEHLSEFQGLVNQLASMKMMLDEELRALLLLSSLPDSWNTLVVSLSNSTPDGTMTMQMVETSLLNEEDRRREQNTQIPTMDALVVEKRGRNQTHVRNNRDKSRNGRHTSTGEMECYHCHKLGHMKRNCFLYKEELGKGSIGTSGSTAYISENEEVLICGESWDNIVCGDTQWVVDSGACFHVASRRDCFKNYTIGEFGRVRMGNGKRSKVEGKGDVHLETNAGGVLVLKNVRHVPDMRLNLMSIGVLDNEGHHSVFGDQKWKLTKGALVLAKGKKEGALYFTHAKVQAGETSARGKGSIESRHKGLVHMKKKELGIPLRGDVLSSRKVASPKACEESVAKACGPKKTRNRRNARHFVSSKNERTKLGMENKPGVFVSKDKPSVFVNSENEPGVFVKKFPRVKFDIRCDSDMFEQGLSRENRERVEEKTEPPSSSAWGRFVGSSLNLEEDDPRAGERQDGRGGSGRKGCPRIPESKQASGRSMFRQDGSRANWNPRVAKGPDG